MIDHVYISVTNIEKSLVFYSEALKPFGWSVFGNYDSASGPQGVPDLYGIGDDVFGSGKAVGSSIWLRQRKPASQPRIPSCSNVVAACLWPIYPWLVAGGFH